MPSARTGYEGLQYHYEQQDIAIVTEANSDAVLFDVAYVNPPTVVVVPPLGSDGTYATSSVTATGFSFAITGEGVLDAKTIPIIWFAQERN